MWPYMIGFVNPIPKHVITLTDFVMELDVRDNNDG